MRKVWHHPTQATELSSECWVPWATASHVLCEAEAALEASLWGWLFPHVQQDCESSQFATNITNHTTGYMFSPSDIACGGIKAVTPQSSEHVTLTVKCAFCALESDRAKDTINWVGFVRSGQSWKFKAHQKFSSLVLCKKCTFFSIFILRLHSSRFGVVSTALGILLRSLSPRWGSTGRILTPC